MVLESFEGNKYLEPFYEEMKKVGPNAYNKYAYPVQMIFLKSRLKRENTCNDLNHTYIIDRSIFEDKYIFAENQRRTHQISEEEYAEYLQFFEENYKTVRSLDVVVYIRVGVEKLVERIRKRGRDIESDIDPAYLGSLQVLYEECLLPALREMNKGRESLVLVYDANEIDADSLAQRCYEDIMAWVATRGKTSGEDGEASGMVEEEVEEDN